ncbi:MAG: flagellar biosynthesis protein FlgE [Planctomycetota bacterium]|nr:MAG: flagellar biosynthesis protein FlgE [Planctomycetota bacterium]
MGLQSSLNTALTGLQAAEAVIDVSGNNLANSNTVGFKSSQAQFATQFLQTQSLGSSPTDTSGGTNPRQIGLGVQVAEITPNFTQGTIQISANASDLAIQGEGFFIVEGGSGEQLYTRNGVFKTNSQNELVTITGNRLLGHGVDDNFQVQATELVPITIPLGSTAVAQATQNVFLEGSLIPDGDIADQAAIIQSAVLGDGLQPRPSAGATPASAALPDTTTTTAASSATAGGLVPGATYRYRFTFVDASGQESMPSSDSVPGSSSSAVTIGAGNSSVQLTNIPDDTSATEPYQLVNIYRTTNGGTNYFLVGQVPAGTASYSDTTADGALGAQLDSTSLDGSYSYYVTFYKTTGEESRPSPLTSSVNVTGNRVHLTGLPTPPAVPPGGGFPAYDRIRIYRNIGTDADSFYLVDTINIGDDYTDSTPDSVISSDDSMVNPNYKELDFDGPPMASNTLLVNLVKRTGDGQSVDYVPVFEEGTLTFTGEKGGRDLSGKEFVITDTTTAQELVNFMTQALGIQGSTADPVNPIPGSAAADAIDRTPVFSSGGSIANGRFQFVSNNGTGNAVDVPLDALTLITPNSTTLNPQLDFGTVQEAIGESATTDFIVYDSLGIPLQVRLTTVLESRDDSSVTYRWFADSGDNDPLTGAAIAVGTGLVTLDGEGNVLGVSEDTVSIDRANVPSQSPLTFDLDFSAISGLAADSSSIAASQQDGFAPGTLSSFIIGEDGRIRGVFSNGVTRDLGQIRLARFANPAGLEQRGENMFAGGVNSGLPVEGNPGEQGIGDIIAGAVELSNTDVGKNLIDLILASTQYRSNTRVITTAQQLIDELLNLRR